METILCLLHTDADGSLPRVALEALAATRALAQAQGAAFSVGMVGAEVQKAGARVATCGATRFLAVSGSDFVQSRYGTDAAAAAAICKAASATLVIAPGTSRWARALPGVAHRLGGRVDTHVASVSAAGGAVAVGRWSYRQRIETELSRKQRPWLLLVDPGIAAAWDGQADAVTLEEVPVAAAGECTRTVVSGIQAPPADAQTIRPDAALLLVAGAGWTKAQADGKPHVDEAARLILGFLAQTKASLGSSKSLVDLSGEGQSVLPFLTHLHQVGQTGATPRHPKGLATCCHGEEPHTVGWRFIGERRAVNLDPGCGWARGKADVLYVADAFQVLAKVNALLAEK